VVSGSGFERTWKGKKMWKLIALMLGYREAYDAEDGRLVVFKNDLRFYSWRDAVLCSLVND